MNSRVTASTKQPFTVAYALLSAGNSPTTSSYFTRPRCNRPFGVIKITLSDEILLEEFRAVCKYRTPASPRDELNPALKEGVNPNQRLKTTVLPIILSGNMVKGKSRTVIVTLNRRPVHISLSMMGDTLDRRRVLTSGCSQ
ncbi:hypothetical protein X801_05445 [Opisthorchis viverrini]|uniref:Uncharacterized protein n=1 Tax=Opisthorchis viverrini TaxID=6198 RepID=A0A1S8WWA0_OPIVI|nr:hypothetical protein X801_05445 [Opisthorchis viverrini]